MSLQITLDIFSGRPNPVITLDGADAAELLKRLQPNSKRAEANVPSPPTSILGYRGLLIEQMGARSNGGLPSHCRVLDGRVFTADGSWSVADRDIEEYLLSRTAVAKAASLPADFGAMLRDELKQRGTVKPAAKALDVVAGPPMLKCACAPLYNPNWWNDGGQRQLRNNCYNYACNYRTDTFAQPGRASGNPITEWASCAVVAPCALSDDLVRYTPRGVKEIECPEDGIGVALVIWPRWDYHWYRLDRSGYWSHKPGSWAVTNLDNAGHLITDPRKADRGRYTDFCCFMISRNGHIKIS